MTNALVLRFVLYFVWGFPVKGNLHEVENVDSRKKKENSEENSPNLIACFVKQNSESSFLLSVQGLQCCRRGRIAVELLKQGKGYAVVC